MAAYLAENGQTDATIRAYLAEKIQWEKFWSARIKEEDLQKYYAEYKDYFDSVVVRASHIVMLLKPTATAADRLKAKAKLEQLRAQIVAGRLDFGVAAQQFSEASSGKDGGDMGFFPRKFAVDDAFAKVAFSLPPGQVSEVVQTEIGMHLIKVLDRRREAKPGEPLSDYAKIKDDVRELYIVDMRQAILADLRKSAKIEINVP